MRQMKRFLFTLQVHFMDKPPNNSAIIMRILLIEDEQKVSALLKRGLTSERYAVDIAADGIEGLELADLPL